MPIRTVGRASPLQGEGHWLIISKKQLLPFYEGKRGRNANQNSWESIALTRRGSLIKTYNSPFHGGNRCQLTPIYLFISLFMIKKQTNKVIKANNAVQEIMTKLAINIIFSQEF